MSHPKDLLNEALKEAMKNKDAQRRDALRLLTSAIKQVEIDTRRELSAEEAVEVLQKEAKKRRESIAELQGNPDREQQLAAERYELALLEEFLPKQLSEDEIRALAQQAISQSGAKSAKELGKVMSLLQPQVKGRADGKLVNQIVRELLGS
ncbi:MAG: GatB/YqeY domain-containing protein [Anaerolineae bacterium]|nr:GatB/YqeY domain-containing protein [Anaerolineae bacterium]MDW8171780.1 GatB/YqeY domain-containing protein [Anaerolineae bacterium]